MQHHVFLSYSRKDTPFMRRVRKDLQRSGLLVWTDEGIHPGTTSWQRSIEEAIIHAGCLMCILSPDAAQSEWVREELHFARVHSKEVFLLMARGDERDSVPFGFTLHQWIDIRNLDAYKSNMKRTIILLHEKFEDMTLARTQQLKPLPKDFGLKVTGNLVEDPPRVVDILSEPFSWCQVSDGETRFEGITHRVSNFYISKHLITAEQFRVFENAPDGYDNPSWFNFSKEAMTWYGNKRRPMSNMYLGDHLPRVYINWYEAMAFTQWLNAQFPESSYSIMLPTEVQWQRAAQGDDNRLYPWGDDYDRRRCNTVKSKINQPSSVLAHPSGASPFGVYDMCGNVSEWCVTDWDGLNNVQGENNRVIRGGAWDSGRSFAQVIIRDYARPHTQTGTIGFRIVAALPSD